MAQDLLRASLRLAMELEIPLSRISYNEFEPEPTSHDFRIGVGPIEKWLLGIMMKMATNAPKELNQFFQFPKLFLPLLIPFVHKLGKQLAPGTPRRNAH